MSTDRHATIREIAADLKARLVALDLFQDVLVCRSTSLPRLLDFIGALIRLPAAVIIIGPADYPADDPHAPPQRRRDLEPGIVVVGEYSAEPDAGDSDVWDLIDALDRSFTPGADNVLVTLSGVEYSPLSMTPISAGDDRSAYLITLRAIDPVQSRSDIVL